MKMILLLGKNDVIEEYAKDTLKIDITKDMMYCPDVTTHYSEFGKYVDIAKENKPLVITTQNSEMIDVFLASDLDFKVITVRRYDDKIRAAIREKEYILDCREAVSFEVRD